MGAPRAQIITEARASGAPVITRSLKFDNCAPQSGYTENPYQHLQKRNPRYGNDRSFTYSCWFKRAQIYGQNSNSGLSKQYLIGSQGDTSGSFIRFNNDNGADTLRILGPNTDLITEANFRDTLGWYHVVVAVDTIVRVFVILTTHSLAVAMECLCSALSGNDTTRHDHTSSYPNNTLILVSLRVFLTKAVSLFFQLQG